MNWRRGLLRTWIVLTIAWVVLFVGLVIVAYVTVDGDFGIPNRELFLKLASLLLVPPIGLLLVGFLLIWTVKGFRRG
jgi:hypothetical protein